MLISICLVALLLLFFLLILFLEDDGLQIMLMVFWSMAVTIGGIGHGFQYPSKTEEVKVINCVIRPDETFDIFLENSKTYHFTELTDRPFQEVKTFVFQTENKSLFGISTGDIFLKNETLKKLYKDKK